jgi:excisionase family DNA binding protein
MSSIEAKNLIREVLNEAWISDYVSPETIAGKTEFDAGTIRKWCRSGELKATKIGITWRIKPKDWQKFCDERTL